MTNLKALQTLIEQAEAENRMPEVIGDLFTDTVPVGALRLETVPVAGFVANVP